MAQVARDLRRQPDVDYHLDYQFRAWGSIPEYTDRWPEMDAIDKEVFHLEWVGITESRLEQLQRWAEQGLLTPTQRDHYDELQQLVAQHRPAAEALLSEP
ncbi:MAG: hypothetical protein H0V51_05250 [Chloroflexi bacterium]|nr:hypothetical protein [Chloroflexota bacterium]